MHTCLTARAGQRGTEKAYHLGEVSVVTAFDIRRLIRLGCLLQDWDRKA